MASFIWLFMIILSSLLAARSRISLQRWWLHPCCTASVSHAVSRPCTPSQHGSHHSYTICICHWSSHPLFHIRNDLHCWKYERPCHGIDHYSILPQLCIYHRPPARFPVHVAFHSAPVLHIFHLLHPASTKFSLSTSPSFCLPIPSSWSPSTFRSLSSRSKKEENSLTANLSNQELFFLTLRFPCLFVLLLFLSLVSFVGENRFLWFSIQQLLLSFLLCLFLGRSKGFGSWYWWVLRCLSSGFFSGLQWSAPFSLLRLLRQSQCF